METVFFVFRAFRYRESKNWEYKVVGMYRTLSQAKDAYHENMSAIMKESNDFAMCIIVDNFGNTVANDFDDTHTEPEEI